MGDREKKTGLFYYTPPTPLSRLSDVPTIGGPLALGIQGAGGKVSRRVSRTGLEHIGYKNRPSEKTGVREWMDKGVSDDPLPTGGRRYHFEKRYYGTTGEKKHLTGEQQGFVDPKIFSKVQGARGEERGKHRNKKGKEWNDFVDDVRNHGVEEIVSINVEPDGTIQVHEGNHRIDAALEAGLDRIPVQIRYYGNAQDLQIPFFNMED